MITKKARRSRDRQPERVESPRADAPEVVENASETVTEGPSLPDGSQRVAVAIYRDKDGKIQWDRMRGKTREQLKAMISDPEVMKGLGIEKPADAPPPALPFGKEFVKQIYGGVAKASVVVAGFRKVPRDVANEAFKFSDDEIEALTPGTVKVIAKYAPEWLIKYQDEIGLAILITTIMSAKVDACKAMMEMREHPKQSRPQPVRREPVDDNPVIDQPAMATA